MAEVTMDKIVSLCRRRGFIFQSSEIYGGLNGAYDYGPLGVQLKNNIRDAWWKEMTQLHDNIVGLDASILMHPRVWEASGHVSNFTDPMVDCKQCKSRFRADQIDLNAPCPVCGNKGTFTAPRNFNLMFATHIGADVDAASTIYLRPETAQGIFVNFRNVQRSARKKIPFGIAQIGKSFRNEITPGNFIFRTREFEQMELEFFCKPGTDLEWFEYWKAYCRNFLLSLGMKEDHLRQRDHSPEELSHYSKGTTDLEYTFPWGWGELWGIADRTDFDLTQHQNVSGQDMNYVDSETGEKYIPYVIEPSLGAGRVALAFLLDAYDEEDLSQDGKEDMRVVLRLHPALAPFKAAVLPLSKKLSPVAEPIYEELAKYFMVDFDSSGSIGKRYRREDEIGTPFCICVDFDTEVDGCVTIRDRDTMDQVRVPVKDVRAYIEERLVF